MKGIIVKAPQVLEMAERENPEVRDGYAVVKVGYSAICGSDNVSWHVAAPNSPGHEYSGWIEEPGTTGFQKGDRVCGPEINPCGECEFCKAGKHNLCPTVTTYSVGMDLDGAYSEYVPIRGDLLRRVPEDIPLELGAIVEPMAVSLHGVHRLGMPAGEKLLVWGNGPIGIYAAFCAKQYGASEIYMVGRGQGRVDLCNTLSYIDKCFSVNDPDFEAKIAEVMPEGGFTYVLDALGSEETFDMILSKTKADGKVALLGLHSFTVKCNAMLLLAKEITLIPSWFFTLEEYDEAFKLVCDNKDEMLRLITNHVPHDADVVQDMFKKLFLSGKNDECKVVIDYTM